MMYRPKFLLAVLFLFVLSFVTKAPVLFARGTDLDIETLTSPALDYLWEFNGPITPNNQDYVHVIQDFQYNGLLRVNFEAGGCGGPFIDFGFRPLFIMQILNYPDSYPNPSPPPSQNDLGVFTAFENKGGGTFAATAYLVNAVVGADIQIIIRLDGLCNSAHVTVDYAYEYRSISSLSGNNRLFFIDSASVCPIRGSSNCPLDFVVGSASPNAITTNVFYDVNSSFNYFFDSIKEQNPILGRHTTLRPPLGTDPCFIEVYMSYHAYGSAQLKKLPYYLSADEAVQITSSVEFVANVVCQFRFEPEPYQGWADFNIFYNTSLPTPIFQTPTNTPTNVSSPTPILATSTPTNTPVNTPTPSNTPTASPTQPSSTPVPTYTPWPTYTPFPSGTPTASPTTTPTATAPQPTNPGDINLTVVVVFPTDPPINPPQIPQVGPPSGSAPGPTGIPDQSSWDSGFSELGTAAAGKEPIHTIIKSNEFIASIGTPINQLAGASSTCGDFQEEFGEGLCLVMHYFEPAVPVTKWGSRIFIVIYVLKFLKLKVQGNTGNTGAA